jgi:hypothetical protein
LWQAAYRTIRPGQWQGRVLILLRESEGLTFNSFLRMITKIVKFLAFLI